MSSTQEVGDIFGEGKGPANAMLRSPTVLIVAVGLWGMNLFFFRLFGINYKFVLTYDLMKEKKKLKENEALPSPPQSTGISDLILTVNDESSMDDGGSIHETGTTHSGTNNNNKLYASSAMDSDYTVAPGAAITWYKLVIFSLILLVMLHTTTRIWMDFLGRGVIGAVLLFYLSIVVYIFIPLSSNKWLRNGFYITLQRTWALLHPRCWCLRRTSPSNPPREIPFVDVFFADAMCSLSKVFFDWGMLLHMMTYYPQPVPQTPYNIIIPSFFAAIPFVIRARQCLLMLYIGKLKNDPKRYHHFANAIKYSTSIWPLLVSAYQKTMKDQEAATKLDPLLYLLQT
jgi:EXS family